MGGGEGSRKRVEECWRGGDEDEGGEEESRGVEGR